MPILVHIANRPITQLAVVNNSSADLCSVTERKGSTRESLRFDALDFALADRANSQRVSDD